MILIFFRDLHFLFSHLQQEQEEHANKPLSDSNEEMVEEKPKNQSIAQIIYNENRVSILTKTSV